MSAVWGFSIGCSDFSKLASNEPVRLPLELVMVKGRFAPSCLKTYFPAGNCFPCTWNAKGVVAVKLNWAWLGRAAASRNSPARNPSRVLVRTVSSFQRCLGSAKPNKSEGQNTPLATESSRIVDPSGTGVKLKMPGHAMEYNEVDQGELNR